MTDPLKHTTVSQQDMDTEMRGWLIDCMSGLDDTEYDRIMAASPKAIRRYVAQDYDGGLTQFYHDAVAR